MEEEPWTAKRPPREDAQVVQMPFLHRATDVVYDLLPPPQPRRRMSIDEGGPLILVMLLAIILGLRAWRRSR